MRKPYNGHESWTAWNVSLWLNNDPYWYTAMRACVGATRTRAEAAAFMFRSLTNTGHIATPDGARFSIRSIRLAMRGLDA